MSQKKISVCNVISLFHPVEGGDENTIKLLSSYLINEYGYEIRVLTRRYGGILNKWNLKPKENIKFSLIWKEKHTKTTSVH